MKHLVFALVFSLLTSCGGSQVIPPQVKPIVECVLEGEAIELVNRWKAENTSIATIFIEAASKAIQIGGCAYAKYTNDRLAPPKGTALPSPEVAHELSERFEEYRRAKAHDSTFRFGSVDL